MRRTKSSIRMDHIYKDWIKSELKSWAETFNNNYPDHMETEIEEESSTFDFIESLVKKYSDGKCSKEDYEAILFHIWQKNYDS